MYSHETCLAVYFTILSGICMNDFMRGKTLYSSLVGMVESRIQHFLLSLFFIGLLYVLGKVIVSLTIGELSPLEKEGVQENGIRYLGNTCLLITLFADNITMRTLVLFAFIFGLKSLHWMVGLRIDALEKSGALCNKVERVVFLTGLLFAADSLLAYQFIRAALAEPGISILFAIEFFTLLAYSIRSLYALSILYCVVSTGIEDKIFLLFYGDFLFSVIKIAAHVVCLVWTTVYFKMPITLLREIISAIKHLTVKTRSMIAYKALITFLEKRPDVLESELGPDKMCLICHEEMEIGKKLECSHVFHLVCLKEWLHRQQACPVCRKEVAPKKQNRGDASTGSDTGQPSSSSGNVSAGVRVVMGTQNSVEEYEGVLVTLSGEQP